MMLTPLNIQVAIIKAFYALAKKSVKYYTGLAFGKNNTCLFKEIRLLRVYIEILKNFKIVGSTITCCCSVEGDYDVLLNEDLPSTVANIQFGCDNQGYMVFNNIGYSFTYWYDNNNNRIVIQFISDAPNPNLITNNPNFAIDLSGWETFKFGWSGYAGIGSAQYVGAIDGGYLLQIGRLEIGKTYTVSFDILTEYFGGTNTNIIKAIAGTQEAVIFQGPIENTEIIPVSTTVTCFGNTNFEITAISDVDSNQSTFYMYITNVDVREVLNTTITIEDVVFTEECNIEGSAPSPIEVAEIEVITNPPVTVDNIYGTWDGSITIATGGNVAFTFPIPVAIIDDPIAIVQAWAADPQIVDWVLLYDVNHFVIYSPFNNIDYSAYTAYFNQYEGGTDATLDFDLSGLPPFVTVNTPSYADILFEQPTFVLSRRPETPSVPVPATLPYSTTTTPAIVDILIPINQFHVGQPATMSIPLYSLFYTSYQDFKYEEVSMFSNVTPVNTIQDVITLFNNSNGLGFTASDGGTQPINETLATAANATVIFNTGAFGDLYIAKLSTVVLGITITTIIGQYTVGDDSPEDIANGMATAIINLGAFTGTVNVTSTVITLTAPLGSGDSWNTVYKFTLQKGVSGRAAVYPFSGGVGTPTIPIHILNIEAPNIYPEASYNGGIITIEYPSDGYEPDGSQFAGGIDSTPGVVSFDDTLTISNIYTSSTVFTSIEEMVEDFNTITGNTLDATAVIMGSDFTNYTVRITVPSPPNAAYDFNGTILNYTYTLFSVYSYPGMYYNGSDITTSTYTLTVYDLFGAPGPVVTNTGNFTDIQSILNEINADPAFNTNFTVFTGEGNDIYMSTILASAAFNGYSFSLDLNYASAEYTFNDFTTPIEPMSGGVDRVAPNISLVNNFNAVTIYSLAQDSYNFNGINGFITAFNTPPTPYNYTANYQGTSYAAPPIYPIGTLAIPFNYTILPNSTLTVVGTTLTPNPLCTYIPIVGNTVGQVTIGLSNAINAGAYAGSATWYGNLLQITGPPTPSNPAFYNGTPLTIYKTEPAARAIANVVVLPSENQGGAYVGPFTIRLQMGILSLGIFTAGFNVVYTPIEIAAAYAAVVNSGTSTHGYSAIITGQGGIVKIRLIAPVNTGESANGFMPTISIDTQNILQSPPGAFSGGTNATSVLATATLNNGRFTAYDTVRFTADPAIYTWEYTDDPINGNLTYTNLSASPDYISTGTFFGGIDNTAGQITLELLQTSTGNSWLLYDDPTAYNYFSFQQWATFISESTSTNLDFSASVVDTNFTIHSPEDSFAYFNIDYNLFLGYNYASPQWLDNTYGQLYTITNGVDPVLESYEGPFVAGVLGDFINTDPCAPKTATQTCLTNSQISKIITHIDKLVK